MFISYFVLSLIYLCSVYDGMNGFVSPRTDPFFTDLSGLTLQSGVGVGPGGRLVKDEYTVGGGGGGGAGTGMDVDGEINQTIQHHPPPPPPPPNNPQPPQQQTFIPGIPPPNPGIDYMNKNYALNIDNPLESP